MSDNKHSELLSPSGSGLWLLCTAMPGEKKARGVKNTAGVAAERGTLQHYFAEQLDLGRIKAEDFAKHTSSKPTDKTLTIEEWTSMRTSVQAMQKFFEGYPSTKFKDYYELEVGFEDWRKDCFGTLDRGRLDVTNRTLFILDHKFGFGEVPATNNSQLRIYALATLEKLRVDIPKIDDLIDTVVLGISQPRIRFEVVAETLSLDDLKQWDRDVLQPAQKAILDGCGAFVPGEHCKSKYCNLREDCQALANGSVNAMDDFMSEFHAANTGDTAILIKALDDTALQDMLDKAPLIELYIEMLQEEADSRIRQGINLERYKIVEGKGKSKWKEGEEEVVKLLKSIKLKAAEMYKKTLLTPAQVRDLLISQERLDKFMIDKLANHMEYVPGSEKLVSVDKKGTPLVFNTSSEDEMDDLLADILGGDDTVEVELDDLDALFADL